MPVRLGAASAVVGSVLAAVGNLLHPVTPRDDPDGVARVIADSDYWGPIHLVIVLGTVLMFTGLIAVRAALAGDRNARALAGYGVVAAAIGLTVGLVTLILDGVAAKQLADDWAEAPASDERTALAMVSVNETINFALASLFNVTFAGATFILFGLAIARADRYPQWLGWVGFAAGCGSVAAGTFQALTGEPTITSLILTIIGPSLITLWLVVVGLLVWRRTAPHP